MQQQGVNDELFVLESSVRAIMQRLQLRHITERETHVCKEVCVPTLSITNAIKAGGVFAGKTPENCVLNGDDLDNAVDLAIISAYAKATGAAS